MITISELAQTDHSWAAERAEMAQTIVEQRNSGAITPSEASELLLDLIATDKLDAVADNIEVKAALITAISAAANFV